jgi:hypothetical protein
MSRTRGKAIKKLLLSTSVRRLYKEGCNSRSRFEPGDNMGKRFSNVDGHSSLRASRIKIYRACLKIWAGLRFDHRKIPI